MKKSPMIVRVRMLAHVLLAVQDFHCAGWSVVGEFAVVVVVVVDFVVVIGEVVQVAVVDSAGAMVLTVNSNQDWKR